MKKDILNDDRILSFAVTPESKKAVCDVAGLLTYSRFESLPESVQPEISVAKLFQNVWMEITAAGTVTDSHRIPFYPDKEIVRIPNLAQR